MPNVNWQASLAGAKRLALRFPGVTGVDYGYKYEAGERTAQLCVRFHVSRKLPLDGLRAHEVLPARVGAVACDVVQAGYAPQASPHTRFDLARAGAGIGNAACNSMDTLGAIVREAGNGRLCVLGSWHVLCSASTVRSGVSNSQRGPLHLASGPERPVALLERWLDLRQGYDAAIAVLSTEAENDATILGLGTRINGVEEPRLGLNLVKAGAASAVTRAMVDGIGGMFELDYRGYGEQKFWMEGFRLVSDQRNPEGQISVAGDSGTVWINPETQRAVALHFGGEYRAGSTAGYTIAHPLSRILNLLDLAI